VSAEFLFEGTRESVRFGRVRLPADTERPRATLLGLCEGPLAGPNARPTASRPDHLRRWRIVSVGRTLRAVALDRRLREPELSSSPFDARAVLTTPGDHRSRVSGLRTPEAVLAPVGLAGGLQRRPGGPAARLCAFADLPPLKVGDLRKDGEDQLADVGPR
jgi:hypothetical protein